jgi:hypothetical protein
MVAYSFKERFIEPILDGSKAQTIRAHGKRRHARPGETLQLYYGMRTRQCRLIATRECASVHRIVIQVGRTGVDYMILDGTILGPRQMRGLAYDDGFGRGDTPALADMAAFWMAEHGKDRHEIKFEGVLIRWKP